MTKHIYGYTKSGKPIDDDLIEALAVEAEAGYDVSEVIARRGTRRGSQLDTSASSVLSVRLDPDEGDTEDDDV